MSNIDILNTTLHVIMIVIYLTANTFVVFSACRVVVTQELLYLNLSFVLKMFEYNSMKLHSHFVIGWFAQHLKLKMKIEKKNKTVYL